MVNIENNQVILLSSTEDPYFRDILDLMFYPSSINYRFRYQRRWVSNDLKLANGELSKAKVDLLCDKVAILTHILTEKKNGNYIIKEFLPIRKASIKEAKIIGDFLWINFTLGDWIYYNQNSSENEPNEYHEVLKSHVNSKTMNIEGHLISITQKLNIATIPDTSEIENTNMLHNWSRIANHVSRFSKLRRDSNHEVVFMKFVRIKNTTDDKILKVKAINSDKQGFALEAEHSYAVEIVEYTDQKIEPFGLEMLTQEEAVSPKTETTEIRGKYDVLNFAFSCKRTKLDSISTIKFNPLSESYVISKPFFWINIKTRKWRYVGFPLIGFAISTLFASEQFVKLVTGQPADLGLLVSSAIGTFLSTYSLFNLRK